jgi:hypothetical protein
LRSPATEQEAEIEEDVEATRVADWDKAAADAAYRVQVEQAQARQRLLEEQRELEVRVPASLPALLLFFCQGVV